ncbi:MAG: NAD(+) synthase [Proteobacteria bacterium]|nr:NAD(+) synthase [Pseudomonadota bacterium]
MRLVKVAAATLNQTPLDWEHNQRNIAAALAVARDSGVSLLCLPELCITGYGCEDAFHSPGVQRQAMRVLAEITEHSRGMVVSVGLPVYHHKALYDAACVLVDGTVAGFVAKRFLAGDGVHYEPRWFKRWPEGKRSTVEIDGCPVPIGDLLFDCGDVRIGFEICEDAWVANRPGSHLARRGVDIILNPSASHFAFGKFAVRQRFVTEGSRAFGVAYVYANLLGNEAGRIIYDGGALIASAGELVARGPRFSFADFELTTAVIDIDENRVEQVRRGSHQPAYEDTDTGCVRVDFAFSDHPLRLADELVDDPSDDRAGGRSDDLAENRPFPPAATVPGQPRAAPVQTRWEYSPHIDEEEFTRALALGLFDYLRKSRAHGFVVSLSGGADSTATAVLVSLAVGLAAEELGIEGMCERLSHIPGLASARDTRQLVHRLLLCAYQATRNSSEVTRQAARTVAGAIGAEFLYFDIDALVDGYIAMVADGIDRSLTWHSDDLALQNIQARARGPGIWLLANLRRSLLLSTSNRSEAAVGYATMDGDTCGGLSPVAGIDKAFLRHWLAWMERVGPRGGNPLPALAAVNAQQPTAELRPVEAAQTDEGDLMPYPLLEAIESAAIGKKRTPVEVFCQVRAEFPHYSPAQLGQWIARFFRLWCRNQWKRERYAPSFHVDDKNLDPKTWCRFPILSGGFERELTELRHYLARVAEEG